VFLTTDSTYPAYYLADTGSAISLICDKALDTKAQVTPFSVPVKAITDTTIPINGICNITLYQGDIGDERPIGDHNFLVTTQEMPHFDGILGSDWFHKNHAIIDYTTSSIITDNFSIPFHKKLPPFFPFL
jgi:hypothetical protein